MSFTFNHFNFNVLNLDRSLEFYHKALGLREKRRKVDPRGRFILVYLEDGVSPFALELTWLADRTEPYNLGDEEFHLAMVSANYDQAHALHQQMGVICYENPEMGLYFIQDPDGYWIEILPSRR